MEIDDIYGYSELSEPMAGRDLHAMLDDALDGSPSGILVAIRGLLLELHTLESRAIREAIGDGWSYGALARQIGVTRQALARRLQREEQDRRPKARIVEERARESAMRWTEERARSDRFIDDYLATLAATRMAAGASGGARS